jgi:hypothetical protein
MEEADARRVATSSFGWETSKHFDQDIRDRLLDVTGVLIA